MDMNAQNLNQNITLHPSIENRFSNRYPEKVEDLLEYRLAIGFVLGVYEGSSEKDLFHKGPNGEQAMADRYAVFYKNGTFDFGLPACAWFNELPQGFSCGKGSRPVSECSRIFEQYVPVPCNEIVMKVAKEYCNVSWGDRYSLEDRENPDCFAFTNYT